MLTDRTTMFSYLRRRWMELWRTLDPQGRVDHAVLLDDLRKRYSEPHRAYHTLKHIQHCFWECDEVWPYLVNRPAVELALWYHDAIYDVQPTPDPQAKDNETRSADLARSIILAAGLGTEFAALVEVSIFMTRHQGGVTNSDSCLVVDIDMAILGQPQEPFLAYEREIRAEYKEIPEETFRKKRAEILHRFLNRPRIYSHPYFQDKYELQARKNLAFSIRQLQAS